MAKRKRRGGTSRPNTQGDIRQTPIVASASRTAELFAAALQHHQAGRFGEAERMYQSILALDPRHVDALHNLGVLAYQTCRNDVAAARFAEAVALDDQVPGFHTNLGAALKALGRLDEAAAAYHRALALQPNYAAAHNNLGAVRMDQGRLDDAAESYRRAIVLEPNYAQAHDNLGDVLKAQGQFAEAEACYLRALSIEPDLAETHANLGVCLGAQGKSAAALASLQRAVSLKPDLAEAHYALGVELQSEGRLDEAAASYRRALAARPNYAEALNDLGGALQSLGQADEAVAFITRALTLKPDLAMAHNNLGVALRAQGKLDEAATAYGRAVALKPELAVAHMNLGNALVDCGRPDEAVASYDKAIAVQPDYAVAHYNRAAVLLRQGRFEDGWPGYEYRRRRTDIDVSPPPIAAPEWAGEPLAGRRLLVFVEQGFGDIIQFARYLPLLTQAGAQVTLLCHRPLHRLLAPVTAGVQVTAAVSADDRFDFQCALLSLPLRLGTTLASIPGQIPYLSAEPAMVERWRSRIGDHGFRIGVCWQGNPASTFDIGRSVPLRAFEPLAGVPGVRLIGLQKTHGLEQLDDLPPGMTVETLGPDFDAGPDAFVDTAAVMASLDLIVTSDTSIVHLAGALDRPVWLALQHLAEWRWLTSRDDSPWYPSLRLYRQLRPGHWASVFDEVARDLKALAGRRLSEAGQINALPDASPSDDASRHRS